MKFIVCSVGAWNKNYFLNKFTLAKGQWFFASNPTELEELLCSGVDPEYIFFPHWRWIVRPELLERHTCVCFHMTDLPFGRGGSPLQNLIVRGFKSTKLTALKMDSGVDSGPIYFKEPIALSGTAHEIYMRVTERSWEMMNRLIKQQIDPVPQVGEVTTFTRRKPEESRLPANLTTEQIYDFIRMLDAPDYPNAFILSDKYRILFSEASLVDGVLTATAKIEVKGD